MADQPVSRLSVNTAGSDSRPRCDGCGQLLDEPPQDPHTPDDCRRFVALMGGFMMCEGAERR